MRTNQTVITLSRDVAPGGSVEAVEADLLDELTAIFEESDVAAYGLIQAPAPYKTGNDGGYRLMRDEEGGEQYFEVRVRAIVQENPSE